MYTISGTRQRNNLVWDSMFRQARPTLTLDKVPLRLVCCFVAQTVRISQRSKVRAMRYRNKLFFKMLNWFNTRFNSERSIYD